MPVGVVSESGVLVSVRGVASALGGVASVPGGVVSEAGVLVSVRGVASVPGGVAYALGAGLCIGKRGLCTSLALCAGVRSGCSVTYQFLRRKGEYQVFLAPGRPRPLLSEHSPKSGQASSRTCDGLTQLCGVTGQ